MADRSFFVTISQRPHFFVFGAGVVLHRPSTFAAFSERVSLIIPLLFSLLALVFVIFYRQKNKRTYFYFGLWLLAPCIVMLKFAVKREQSQACLNYAEREQIGRSQNGGFQYRGTFKSSATLPIRVFTDAISSSLLFPRTWKSAAICLRLRVLSDALSLCVMFDGWVDLICALFNV